jgi:HlyD family secretion protein
MKRPLRIVILLLVVLAAGASGYYYLYLPRAQANLFAQAQPTAVHYQAVQVQRGSFTNTIETTGTIRSNQTSTLVWQTTGSIQTVAVTKGQQVLAKDVLAELEQTSLTQPIILAQADLVTAQKALDNLLSSTQARANAELALVKAQKALDDAEKTQRNGNYQVASSEQIDIARAALITANDALDKAKDFWDKVKDGAPDSTGYATGLARYAKARQAQILAQNNYDTLSQVADPLDVEETNARVDVAQANLLQAKLDWERVKDGPNEQDVSAAQARVAAAQAAINMAQIKAPFAGTITLANSKAGDQVTPGTLAFQIDDLSHLYVDVAVAEIDIARVKLGLPVSLALDALPGKTYAGAVTDIASVSKNTANTVNFTVTVEISQPDLDIRPGMTVSASIATNQAQNLLFVPGQAIRTVNGQPVVYLLRDGVPIPVAVQAGDTITGGDVLILRGALKEGDLVITNPSSIP